MALAAGYCFIVTMQPLGSSDLFLRLRTAAVNALDLTTPSSGSSVSAFDGSSLLVTGVTLGYMLVLIVLSWIHYDQRRAAESEFQQHRRQLEGLISQRAEELQKKNEELEKKIAEIRTLQDSVVAQKKLASLGKLSAGIAHEIKNPLNMINNSAKTIIDFVNESMPGYVERVSKYLERQEKEYFLEDMNDIKVASEIIVANGARANSIINNMLSQVARRGVQARQVGLVSQVDESLSIVYHTMRALNPFSLEIQKEYDAESRSFNVHEDFGRVFTNVFENAFYAMKEKRRQVGDPYQPVLKIKIQSVPDKVLVLIGDNGIGIPKDVLENVMEPFFTTKPPGEGTGLGLSMVHDLVTANGGDVDIVSESGVETTVRIQLPKRPQERSV